MDMTNIHRIHDQIDLEEFIKIYDFPKNDIYEYETFLENRNLDKSCDEDIKSGKGFIIGPSSGNIKKDLYDDKGIFSSLFGTTLEGMNLFKNNYRCKCKWHYAIYNGERCPDCGEVIHKVVDDFEFFAWIRMNEFYIINPSMYMKLKNLIGKDLDNIIKYDIKKDQDGNNMELDNSKQSPYNGIGIIEFRERIIEILEFYKNKKKANTSKLEAYNDIMKNIDCIFTRSIPVYTTQLRPYYPDGESFHYGDVNEMYMMMNTIVTRLNKDNKLMKNDKRRKQVELLLYDLQTEYNKLYDELVDNLQGKKGIIRSLFGGRYTFTTRGVITAEKHLDLDQISLSYFGCSKAFEQRIINILCKSYSMEPYEAYLKWYMGTIKYDDTIANIIMAILKQYKNMGMPGAPILLNRNPTLVYGGIQQMFISEITDGYTMGLPLTILKLFNADFDGDAMNILHIINSMFFTFANNVLNPRNAMCISRNDGLFNNKANHSKDTIINLNSLVQLGRKYYTEEELNEINSISDRI